MDPDECAELLRAVLSGQQAGCQQVSAVPLQNGTREERIRQFNEAAAKCNRENGMATTNNFNKKLPSNASLGNLRPIKISQLEVGKTHRGRAVFCRVASHVLLMNSASVLVEDDSDMVPLAVYGLSDVQLLREGCQVAIIEPFFKVRSDGTKGIRVDDPSDIVFDADPHAAQPSSDIAPSTRVTAETGLEELLVSDPSISTNGLHKRLVEEGYNISRKRVKALKASFLQRAEDNKDAAIDLKGTKLTPILSERQPEKHRVLNSPIVLKYKEAGNVAFKSRRFEEAEQHYSAAIEHADDKGKCGDGEGVSLWQLYGNRCAARLKVGMLDEAMEDSLLSNMCAPADVIKPVLRCADALSALGFSNESTDLLDSAMIEFPEEKVLIEAKKKGLAPKQILRVGPEREFASISDAVRVATAGAEVLVDSGIYREPLLLSKPVTLRCTSVTNDYAAIRDLEGSDNSEWAEIRVKDCFPICCPAGAVCIVGFRIICEGEPMKSLHSVYATSGATVVLRNCSITSSSGPVVAAEKEKTRMILQTCAVYGGAQGGIMVLDNAKLSLQQAYCCQHAAAGLELRDGGSALVERSHFYNNGRQGIFSWKSAGILTVKHSEIHSNEQESGVLVSEAEAILQSCKIYGNSGAGVVSQQKGRIQLLKCEVHDNLEGILIQDTGSGRVEQCEVFSNRANGIFVGFDHMGSAVIVDNKVHGNVSKGVFVGNSGRVVVRGNEEHNNRGLPPQMPTSMIGGNHLGHHSSFDKHLKRLKKNKSTIEKAFNNSSTEQTFLDQFLQENPQKMSDTIIKTFEKVLKECDCCNKMPPNGEEFKKCSRCRAVAYCSPKCQKIHWPEHKADCKPKAAKYPAFIDSQTSVDS